MDALPSARFLPTVANAPLALLCLASLMLAVTDLRRGIIPDWANLLIAVVGLARAVLLENLAAALAAGCEGIAGGAVVWLLRWLFFRPRKHQRLGLGDVQLLAASSVLGGIARVPLQLIGA